MPKFVQSKRFADTLAYLYLNQTDFNKKFLEIEKFAGTLMEHLPKIGRNYIWELYLNLNRFSGNLTHIILDLIHYAMPNFVQIDGYIGNLVHHLPEIGRKYIWELYLNRNRFSPKVTHIVQYAMQNFMRIEGYIGTLVHHLHKIG